MGESSLQGCVIKDIIAKCGWITSITGKSVIGRRKGLICPSAYGIMETNDNTPGASRAYTPIKEETGCWTRKETA